MFPAQIILLLIEIPLTFLVGYLLLLTAAARRAERTTQLPPKAPTKRFLILIPAHNEARLLPETLAALGRLDYPKSLYAVHLVADNCTDDSAELGRQGGAVVHERRDLEQRGKGYALQWLLQRLWDAEEAHDGVVILDADTIMSANFLRVMAARLARGERVVQAYYAVRSPRSTGAALRFAALAVLHYLRPLGRMKLGGSAGLKGNGMLFSAEILRRHRWSASLTEDIELHMNLLLNGESVMFAPDAIVEAEMPDTFADAHTQNVRWERGRIQMARRYLPRLLRAAFTSFPKRTRLLLDAAMEHIIPPLSVMATLAGLCLLIAVSLAFGAGWSTALSVITVIIGGGLILGQAVYLWAGLRLVGAPKSVYRALWHIPAFVLWKLRLYIRVLLGFDREGWVRTARNNER